MEKCENCGIIIPPAEMPFLSDEQVFCEKCFKARNAATDSQDIPGYRFVDAVGKLLMLAGALVGIIAIIAVFMALIASQGSSEDHGVATFVASALLSVVFGVLVIGCGQLLLCVRDIARNSFRRG